MASLRERLAARLRAAKREARKAAGLPPARVDFNNLYRAAVARRRKALGLPEDSADDVDPFQVGRRPTTTNWVDAVRSVSDRPDDGTPLAEPFMGPYRP